MHDIKSDISKLNNRIPIVRGEVETRAEEGLIHIYATEHGFLRLGLEIMKLAFLEPAEADSPWLPSNSICNMHTHFIDVPYVSFARVAKSDFPVESDTEYPEGDGVYENPHQTRDLLILLLVVILFVFSIVGIVVTIMWLFSR